MIIIREVFIAKPGQASSLARLMSEVMPDSRVMTDMTGVFNKVVMETEMEDLGAFEARMKEYMNNKEAYKKMAGYTDMYTSGKREIYRIVNPQS
jgi:hypothetical protein